jgi:hypothetical protein
MPSSFPAWATPETAPTARSNRYKQRGWETADDVTKGSLTARGLAGRLRLRLGRILLLFQARRALRAFLVFWLILATLVADNALPAGLVRQISLLLIVTTKAAVARMCA